MTTALIGCGARGVRAHGATAAASEKVELVAVCDLDEGRRVAAAEELGVPGVADYAELLAWPELDSVIISTATRAHESIAVACLAAGKHVLVEKPLATEAAAARRMAEVAEARGLVGMVGYQHQFTAFARDMKREVEKIDPIQALLTIQRPPLRQHYFFPDHYGGIVDAATHTIFLALWLMGGEPQAVYGSVHRGSMRGDETLEAINLSIEVDGGARTVTVLASQYGAQALNVIQFIGRRGHVTTTDRQKLHVVTHAGQQPPDSDGKGGGVRDLASRVVETAADRNEATATMLDHFADLITGAARTPEGATFRQGMYAVAVTQAMVEAARTGRRVPLSSIL